VGETFRSDVFLRTGAVEIQTSAVVLALVPAWMWMGQSSSDVFLSRRHRVRTPVLQVNGLRSPQALVLRDD
jgi:hypothetical protein